MRPRSQARAGFTMVEMLVTVLIFAVLLAVAMPIYLSALADSQAKDCRDNLQTIANLEREYRIKNSAHTYTTNLSDLGSLPPGVPVCPSGGTYSIVISNGTQTAQNGQTVPSGGLIVQCSIASHGVYAPGIDTN